MWPFAKKKKKHRRRRKKGMSGGTKAAIGITAAAAGITILLMLLRGKGQASSEIPPPPAMTQELLDFIGRQSAVGGGAGGQPEGAGGEPEGAPEEEETGPKPMFVDSTGSSGSSDPGQTILLVQTKQDDSTGAAPEPAGTAPQESPEKQEFSRRNGQCTDVKRNPCEKDQDCTYLRADGKGLCLSRALFKEFQGDNKNKKQSTEEAFAKYGQFATKTGGSK